jgi:PAS domain S-box-containing protein/putative nucleotidyltransferase with HDIG domain
LKLGTRATLIAGGGSFLDKNANGADRKPPRTAFGGRVGSATRIVFVYAVVAGAWIFVSDGISRALMIDPNLLTTVAIAKGVFFVVVTSALLFVQIRDDFARLEESGDRLRESEYRFRRVVEVSPIPMAMFDEGENITLVNAAFVALLGYTRDDIPTLEQWWPAAYPDPEYRRSNIDAWQHEFQRSRMAGDAFVPIQARIQRKGGAERVVLLSSASLGVASSENVVVFLDITEREQAEESVLRSNERLELVLKSVIVLIGKVIETRDPYTQGHEEGVARIGRLIAEEMGLPSDEVDAIEVAGLVHDVGKLGVPAEILTKPGTISDAERELIKDHSRQGYEILKGIDFDWPIASIVLQHHERMDGSGYPAGLRGDEISVAARVLMAADVIEAMGAHRPYRPALGVDAAIAEIVEHPEQFDPQVVAACVRLHEAGRIEV